MSSKSSINGKGYEFAYVLALKDKFNLKIETNSSYKASLNAFNLLSQTEKELFLDSAKAGVDKILELEPTLKNDINLKMQSDKDGEFADVRDIVFGNDDYEIGVSIKHNHFAVKHSRLSANLDFGKKWYGIPCSDNYFESIKPIFDTLKKLKDLKKDWKEIENKNDLIYKPILTAFKNEILKQNKSNNIANSLTEYMLGKFDFYKAIGLDKQRITQILVFNLRGNLNRQTKKNKNIAILPISKLPNRIISLDFKPNSKNTLELYLNNGWSFKFRIHNASTKVEPSLKFDIGFLGIPATIITFNTKF